LDYVLVRADKLDGLQLFINISKQSIITATISRPKWNLKTHSCGVLNGISVCPDYQVFCLADTVATEI